MFILVIMDQIYQVTRQKWDNTSIGPPKEPSDKAQSPYPKSRQLHEFYPDGLVQFLSGHRIWYTKNCYFFSLGKLSGATTRMIWTSQE